MSEAVKQVTDASFASDVLAAERPVLVDFFAGWCGPCHALAPTLEQLASKRAGEVDVVKLDVDANPEVLPKLERLNDGQWIIPTVEFADGSALVNPSLAAVLAHMNRDTSQSPQT